MLLPTDQPFETGRWLSPPDAIEYQFRPFLILKFYYFRVKLGQAVAQLVEALRYKTEGCGFHFRWCHWNFFIGITLPAGLWPWG